jgi:hypothetical protein
VVNIAYGGLMASEYSTADLLDFLSHAGERGLMPAATAQALAVAVRNVFGILTDDEQRDIRGLDVESTIKRFNNRRAKDFSPSSLKEYGRRAKKAVELYGQWRENPADFSVRTRASSGTRKDRSSQVDSSTPTVSDQHAVPSAGGGYQSAFPVRPGQVITIVNIPQDLTASEAERLAQFVRMLAVQ